VENEGMGDEPVMEKEGKVWIAARRNAVKIL